jgi:ketosteroid isomerase-like protein
VRARGCGQGTRSGEQRHRGIEASRRLVLQATLSQRADYLANLWTENDVTLLPGVPAETGRDAIYASDKLHEQKSRGDSVLSCVPDLHEVQVVDRWAFEWGEFALSSSQADTDTRAEVRGKVLRIIKRQTDGSWKFAVLMVDVSGGEDAYCDPARQGAIAMNVPSQDAWHYRGLAVRLVGPRDLPFVVESPAEAAAEDSTRQLEGWHLLPCLEE